jgi:ABC-2 type transport system ATP-binding protein
MKYAIEARGLAKRYGDVDALRSLSFSMDDGTTYALLGPNGAGKSTTVRILTTLTTADEGEASVAGLDVLRQPAAVRAVIGVVGQRTGVDPNATGRENLVLQGEVYGLDGAKLRSRVDELLGRFGLAEAAGRLVRTYSGGMQRRLDIAMGLVHRPRVLFLDEPTTGLDPEARAGLWGELERLNAEEGLAVLLTTHYLDEADRLAARLAIVDGGEVVAEGTPEELKSGLRGDTLHVELGSDEQEARVRVVLERLDAVREITLERRTLRARADNGARAVPLVLQQLESEGIPVASVTVARPSLDDVYLHVAGRTFAQAEAA